ncbi:MAG: hypothetical protein JW915_22835 [Chitinispirillaceae bacterium]|nr:hypothetical protein [Chitinispirillaceae bacterium]
MKKYVLIFLLTVICTFAACSNIAGTASEVDGKYAVKGQVVENTGNPVDGAIVRIRPDGYLAFNGKPSFAIDTFTDRTGFFYIDSIPENSYTIEINFNKKRGALHQLSIRSTDSIPIVLPVITVSPTGGISGRINLPISDDTARPWIALYSVDYMVQAPYTQEFTFGGIPEGIYSLRIVPFFGSKLEVNLHDITVTGNSTTDVGTLNFTIQPFFKGCTSFECDSIAVQEILHANGLKDVTVHSVITRDSGSGRIVELDLSSRMISTVPKDIGSLSRLRTLNLRNNAIRSIPEQIGYLQVLSVLFLDSNILHDLPQELGYLDSLKTLSVSHNNLYRIADQIQWLHISDLDISYNYLVSFPDQNAIFPDLHSLNLDHNKIATIPKYFVKREFKFLSVNYNSLCSLSTSLSDWLDSFDKDWKSTQECTQAKSNR